MATDKLIRDVIEQLKKTIQFLEKLEKFKDRKQKSDRDTMVKDLNGTIDKCTRTIGGGSISGSESMTYDDVVVDHDGQQQAGPGLYDDVNNQGGTYDDVTVNNSGGDDAGDVYEDGGGGNYDDVSMAIAEIEGEKLVNPTKADYLEVKKDKSGFLKSAWQKRWCVLHKGIFYMYDGPKDKKQKDAFRIMGFEFRPRDDISKEARRKERCFELKNKDKVYEFCASDKEGLQQWHSVFGGPKISNAASQEYNDVVVPAPPGGKGFSTYDDTAGDIYEDTATETTYDDTSGQGLYEEEGPSDVYEDTAQPTPPRNQLPLPILPPTSNKPGAPQRRGSAREELPPIPNSPKPGYPNSSGPALPPRDETGSASGSFGRGLPKPPPPGDIPQRSLPALPSNDSRPATPGLPPPPPPIEDSEIEEDVDLNDFGDSKDDYINMYQGIWDCYPDEENELLFKRGEIIHILSKEYEDYGWWVAENRSEQIGLVPTSYIMKAYDI